MSLKVRNVFLLVLVVVLASITTNILWARFDWHVLPQILLIVSIALIGEHLISSQGYYYYTRQDTNGPFFRNVPLWIPFLWVFSIQASFLISLILGLNGFAACLFSGWLASLGDFLLLEPFMSRMMQLWLWTPVERGYFSFIPSRFNRFIAPPGNYLTWLIFPILANSSLGLFAILL